MIDEIVQRNIEIFGNTSANGFPYIDIVTENDIAEREYEKKG